MQITWMQLLKSDKVINLDGCGMDDIGEMLQQISKQILAKNISEHLVVTPYQTH